MREPVIKLNKGRKYDKGEIASNLHRIRITRDNSVKFFGILQDAGYIVVRRRMVRAKKDLFL